MKHSTTLLSKISKTKKRLSEEQWHAGCGVFAISILLVIVMAGFRAVSMTGSFSSVHGELPVLSVPPRDLAWHRYEESPSTSLRRSTPAVVLTTDAFYFGDMKTFSEDFHDNKSKYIIRHIDGEPQLQTLIRLMDKWIADRRTKDSVPDSGVIVLVPSGEIPTPIVIQVMAGLQKSENFKRVVLGAGIL